jgi:polar amino acid transport system substrate-binding protein
MRALFILFSAFGGLVAGCTAPKPDPTWQRIQEQGVIRVGMEANWVPFEFVDGSGQLIGFDVELARALGERMGLEVQFVANLSFDGLYDALTADRVDMVISAMVVDMDRSADFAFSTPYFDAGQVLVVGPGSADVDGMKDLDGRVLAVELGSEGDSVARRWARRLTDLSLLHTDSAKEALAVVAEGRADAALTDRATALMTLRDEGPFWATNGEGRRALAVSGEPVTGEQYAIVVRRDSSALLQALNQALVELRRDGALEALERKWLGP